jgi:hypothetical protein
LLGKHKSRDNLIIGVKFDDIFREFGSNLIRVLIRKKIKPKLSEAWILLHRARSFGSERQNNLIRLNELLNQLQECDFGEGLNLLQEPNLKEVLALKELLQYEQNRSGES